jgi:hypothetical protein
MMLLVSWEIVTGNTASDAQVRGVHDQARAAILGSAPLRTMPDAQHQAVSEVIAYHVMIFSAANAEAMRTGDQAKLAQLRENVRTAARTFGIDLAHAQLTDKGFKKTS